MYSMLKQVYKPFLLLISGSAVIVTIFFLLSGGLAIAALFIGGPFVLGALAVLWLVYKNLDHMHGSLTRPGTVNGIIAYIVFGSFVFGLLLLLQFSVVGGPNKGQGKFLISSTDNPYLQMQIGFGSIALSGVLSGAVVITHKLK